MRKDVQGVPVLIYLTSEADTKGKMMPRVLNFHKKFSVFIFNKIMRIFESNFL